MNRIAAYYLVFFVFFSPMSFFSASSSDSNIVVLFASFFMKTAEGFNFGPALGAAGAAVGKKGVFSSEGSKPQTMKESPKLNETAN